MTRARLDFVIDCAEPTELVEFWREALGYRVYYEGPTLAVLVPPEGDASPLILQQVPEPKTTKNRAHLDIVADDVTAEVERLVALGARRAHEGVQHFGPTEWVTMHDPEGNEFCVS